MCEGVRWWWIDTNTRLPPCSPFLLTSDKGWEFSGGVSKLAMSFPLSLLSWRMTATSSVYLWDHRAVIVQANAHAGFFLHLPIQKIKIICQKFMYLVQFESSSPTKSRYSSMYATWNSTASRERLHCRSTYSDSLNCPRQAPQKA